MAIRPLTSPYSLPEKTYVEQQELSSMRDPNSSKQTGER